MSIEGLNEKMLDKVGIVKSTRPTKFNQQYYVIYWPDGSIRWIFSVTGMSPGFLAFYPVITTRARMGAAIMRLVSLFGLMGLVAKKIDSLKIEKNGLISNALIKYQCDGWALFAGTPGIDRKIVLSISRGKEIIKYIKVPISTQSYKLIANELLRLKQLENLKLKSIIIPHVEKLGDALVIENVCVSSVRASNELTDVHLRGLREIFEKTHQKISLKTFEKNNNLISKFQLIKEATPRDKRIDVDKVINIANHALKNMSNLLTEHGDKYIDVCFSHRDFTPWNSFVSDKYLVLIDLELSEDDLPVGFDISHYTVQNMLMLDRMGNIRAKEKAFELVRQYIANCYTVTPICYKLIIFLYAIKQAGDYLEKYIDQEEVHRQVFAQIDYWHQVLSEGWE